MTTKSFTTFLGLCLFFTLKSQTINTSHPRLLVNSNIRTKLIAKKDANVSEWLALSSEAYNYANKPIAAWTPETQNNWNTDYIFYSYCGSSWQDATLALAMAHLVNKPVGAGAVPSIYSNKLIDLADTIMAAYYRAPNVAWSNPLSVNNYYPTRHLGYILGIIYDWCYDELGATRRTNIINVMNAMYDEMRSKAYQRKERATGNYYWGHALCAAFWGYATHGDNPRAAEMIAYARRRYDGTTSALLTGADDNPDSDLMQTFLGGYKPYAATAYNGLPSVSGAPNKGGLQIQGWGYGAANFARILDYMLLVKTATDVDEPANQQAILTQLLRGMKHSMLPRRYEIDGYSDWGGNTANYVPLSLPFRLAALLEGTTSGANAQYFAYSDLQPASLYNRTVWDLANWEKMLFYDATRASAALSEPLYYSGFNQGYNLGGGNGAFPYFIMRSDWSGNATWASFNASASNYDDHQHFMAGAPTIKRGNDYLLVNAGSWHDGFPNGLTGNSTLAENSGSKSTLFFHDNFEYQQNTPSAIGGQFYYGKDDLKAVEMTPQYSYIRGDYTSCYNASGDVSTQTNRRLNKFYRDFVYLRTTDVFLVSDYVSARAATPQYRKHLRWHFPDNVPTVNGNTINATYGSSKLAITTLVPAAPSITTHNQQTNSDNTFGSVLNYYFNSKTGRAEVAYAAPQPNEEYLTVLKPNDNSATDATVQLINSNDGKMHGAKVTLPNGTTEFALFSRDQNALQTPILATNYTVTNACSGQHTLTGMMPLESYQISTSGNTVFVTQKSGGTAVASEAGVLRFLPCPIPVELLSFSGKTEGQNNILMWETASEQGVSHFELEKSADGKLFNKIGAEHAKNTPSVYQFVDKTSERKSYYRLKTVENDGAVAYSKIITLENQNILKRLKIYPNPASDVLSIEHTEGVDVEIINSLGQVVLSLKKSAAEMIISIADLPKGVYWLKSGQSSSHFIKK
ncbi:MAG: T9SS type A sorting domain-containing protein [Saprospiraceae bacterium]|nr:T9SS type A sorting domain-containing protein [Saprospiraceae bacterium]